MLSPENDRNDRFMWDGDFPAQIVHQGDGEVFNVEALLASADPAPSSVELEPNTAEFAIREAFMELGGVQKSSVIFNWVNERYPGRWSDSEIRSYLRRSSVNAAVANRIHPNSPRFLYRCGHGVFELYDPQKHGELDSSRFIHRNAETEMSLAHEFEEMVEEFQSDREFAYEAHLRDYLATNLPLLEAGLTLWTTDEEASVEFVLGRRRVDILAKDSKGIPVVIELKLSKGHERTLGQALYYRGKLKQLLGVPRVRIIMVASQITNELRIASAEVVDVDLFEYALTMQVNKL